MRVLFVGLKVGQGLISICNSVKAELDKYSDIESIYIDIYAKNPKMAKFCSEFYYKLVKFFPHTVALGQKIAFKKSLSTTNGHKFLDRDVQASKIELINYINEFRPDVIYTPVNFVATALDELIEEGKTKVKYVFQMPDFMVAYYSHLLKHCTYLISSCEEVTQILLNNNFDKEKIKTLGIPINSKFLLPVDKKQVREQFGLPDKKYIIISNGGAGFANNFKIVKYFYDKIGDYNIIVINGNNLKSKDKIQKFIDKNKITNIINIGFTKEIEKLMSISDIMIGKCGSSTLCEASTKGLKYIALNNMLFPEIKNIEFLKSRNAALVVKNIKQIEDSLKFYISKNSKSEVVSQNFKNINITNNSIEIAKILSNLANK